MNAPTCPVCNVAHWPREGHQWAEEERKIEQHLGLAQRTTQPRVQTTTTTAPGVDVARRPAGIIGNVPPWYARTHPPCAECAAKDARIAALEAQLAPKVPKRDRAAYMRAYRAKARA